eukprot:TRINITY_DN24404_c0_g2_i1.p1 TRINITY_DN24404_c0_g2~~TRINITY_DN24404_c0_g2_i1.p1  ORF type:complete len:306 (-),score=39.86 TRINITY_DN24404_c0_g2_i1:122-988(-)
MGFASTTDAKEHADDSFAHLVSGALAAAFTKACIYPLETLSVLYAIGGDAGVWDLRLLHGIAFACFESAHFNGVQWCLKERVRSVNVGRMLQLLIAANLTLVWNHPFANIVAGMQASLKGSTGPRSWWEVAQDIFATAGVWGFWFGLPMSIVLSGSNATMLYFYEVFSAFFHRRCEQIPEGVRIFVAAMLGRMMSVLLFQPLKVLRARVQAAAAGGAGIDGNVLSDMWDVGPSLFLLGLYAGVTVMCFSEGLKVATRVLITEKMHGIVVRVLRACRSIRGKMKSQKHS